MPPITHRGCCRCANYDEEAGSAWSTRRKRLEWVEDGYGEIASGRHIDWWIVASTEAQELCNFDSRKYYVRQRMSVDIGRGWQGSVLGSRSNEGMLGVFQYKIKYIERYDAARDGIIMQWRS